MNSKKRKLDLVVHNCNLALKWWKQQDSELKATICYIMGEGQCMLHYTMVKANVCYIITVKANLCYIITVKANVCYITVRPCLSEQQKGKLEIKCHCTAY